MATTTVGNRTSSKSVADPKPWEAATRRHSCYTSAEAKATNPGLLHPWLSSKADMEDQELSNSDFLVSLVEFIGNRTGPVTLMLLAEMLNDLAEEKLSRLNADQQFLKRIGMRWE
jgi:hypothetical protein